MSSEYSVKEREEMLKKMRALSDSFYAGATRAGVHAFIEFCGLMNEFIAVCRDAHMKGQDFPFASTHSGRALPFKDHHLAYLAEKLNCIYGPALLSKASRRDIFIKILFDGQFKLTPVKVSAEDIYSQEGGEV